ncbi:fumarylacetoacetate hydrolase domain-containing protein 2a-related [Holotrichia oblita]|nr:fumarylacetoacetate hydrolase domain-containing protein 2a-related [Holotrichia oblita]
MKLVTFTRGGISRIGAMINDHEVVDLHLAFKAKLEAEGKLRAKQIAHAFIPNDMIGFLQGGEESKANAIIGSQDDISFYPISEQLDYEAEFAFVIGKTARHVKQAKALDYIAGYTIANDVTYRDIQRRTPQWLQGKTVEDSTPMGPFLLTTDELVDPSGLTMVLTVNGVERQRANTANLIFTVPYLVEFLSKLVTLNPGDVILTGTPSGVGVAMKPPVFLKDGDVIRIEIDQLGGLENRVKRLPEMES